MKKMRRYYRYDLDDFLEFKGLATSQFSLNLLSQISSLPLQNYLALQIDIDDCADQMCPLSGRW